MNTLSPDIIEKFCIICNWAYESWITRRAIFDNNQDVDKLMKSECGAFFSRLSEVTQEYALLQLIKLHDPAVMGNGINLTFEYVINFGGWDQETVLKLQSILSQLDQLKQSIKPARNKVICHNDLKAIIDDLPLGEFDKDKDVEYFNALQEFVNIVYDKAKGEPYPFNDLAKTDAEIFCNLFVIEQ